MARTRSLLWTRIIAGIAHPEALTIPYLTGENPDEWPEPLKSDPWFWTGATTREGSPSLRDKGKLCIVARLLYVRLVGPLTKNHRLLGGANLLDLNPRHHTPKLLNKTYLPAALPDTAPPPCFADEFEVEFVSDMLDGMNPRDLSDLRQKWPDMLREYFPFQVFEALQRANLADRLGIKSPLELHA
jgi:hypothetical protein